jgi:hypothetical protein
MFSDQVHTALVPRLLIAVVVLVCTPAKATEPLPSTAYQLNPTNHGPFRFGEAKSHAPASLAVKDIAIPVQLVDLPFALEIQRASRQAALDPMLVHALIFVESRYNPVARSPKGAIGLMQLMPGTARRYGVTKAVDAPEANLRAGTHYLSDLITLFDNRIDLALAAYNAGENAVLTHGMRIPPYRETREYVPAVLARYRELKEADPAPGKISITYLPGTRLDPESLRTLK